MGEQRENKNKLVQPSRISLKKNSARAIIGIGLLAVCASVFISSESSWFGSIIFCLTLIYYASTTFWLRVAKRKDSPRTYFRYICTADAFVCAASLAFFAHNYWISGIFFLLILFQAIMSGSLKQALNDSGMYLIGSGSLTYIFSLPWLNENHSALAIALICAIIYLVFYAYFIERKVQKLNIRASRLHSEVVMHKVRGYKLSRYVSPTVWDALNSGKDAALKAERKRVSVFFSDIAGFSALSEELEAETLTELLNTYLTEMVKIAAKHEGTIDKFMGDGLMVIFGDTNSKGMKADCLQCVSMAIDMKRKMKELETRWFNQGIKQSLKIRMGINSGYCTVGSFGTSEYMDYTALGTHVNLASRLEYAADSGEILVSHETWSLIKDVVMCRDHGEINAKGFSHPIKVYQVVDFRKNLGKNQSYFEEKSDGFSMHLDLDKLKNYDKVRLAARLEDLADHIRDQQ